MSSKSSVPDVSSIVVRRKLASTGQKSTPFSISPTRRDCAICFERISVDQKLLRCGHQFHGGCVDQWFCRQKHRSCPLCRTPVTPKQQNDSSRERSMASDDTDEEEYEDHYQEDRHEEDDTYEYEEEYDDEEQHSDATTENDGEVTLGMSSSTSASVTVDESMDLESISSNESFSSNEVEHENDSEATEGMPVCPNCLSEILTPPCDLQERSWWPMGKPLKQFLSPCKLFFELMPMSVCDELYKATPDRQHIAKFLLKVQIVSS